MAFRFKDLMINVASGGGGGDTPVCTYDTVEPKPLGMAATCTYDTVDPAGQAGTCTFDTVGARAGGICTIATVIGTTYDLGLTGRDTGVCTFDTVRPNAFLTVTTVTTVTTLVTAGTGPASLAQLKAQLQQALADVERREREQEAAGLPKTVAEADDLARRLEGALEELRDHRKTLEKDGSKGAKKEAPKARKGRK
jgi:hypothetical protein